MNTYHIDQAIKQAKKEGNKRVKGFTGGIDEHNEYLNLLNEGKFEVFTQKYKIHNFELSCLLMRKPKTK